MILLRMLRIFVFDVTVFITLYLSNLRERAR